MCVLSISLKGIVIIKYVNYRCMFSSMSLKPIAHLLTSLHLKTCSPHLFNVPHVLCTSGSVYHIQNVNEFIIVDFKTFILILQYHLIDTCSLVDVILPNYSLTKYKDGTVDKISVS